MDSFAGMTLSEFLDQLAAKSPAPGGGAAACIAGATGAALAHMVVAYSLGKKNLAEHQPELEAAAAALARARELLLGLADEDAAAYGLVNELTRLPETDPRRIEELPAAAEAAVSAPRATLAVCVNTLELIESLCGKSNRHLRSDLAIAAVLCEAAACSAWWNVAVNLTLLTDEGKRTEVAADGERECATARAIRERVERACTAA